MVRLDLPDQPVRLDPPAQLDRLAQLDQPVRLDPPAQLDQPDLRAQLDQLA